MQERKQTAKATSRPKPQRKRAKRRFQIRYEDFVLSIPGGELRTAVKLSPSANAFLQRSMGAMLRIASAEKENRLTEAMAAPTDVGTVARALANSEVIGTAVAELDPGVIGKLLECDGAWCRLNVKGYEGWLLRTEFWGVFPDEVVKD